MKKWPDQLFINNNWVDGVAVKKWDVINPANGALLASVAINGGGALRANVPVYGYKMSGIGAELGFEEAVHEYTNSKALLYSLGTEKSPWPE